MVESARHEGHTCDQHRLRSNGTQGWQQPATQCNGELCCAMLIGQLSQSEMRQMLSVIVRRGVAALSGKRIVFIQNRQAALTVVV